MKKWKLTLTLLSIALLIGGCSTQPAQQEQEGANKTYSASTEKTFEEIEKGELFKPAPQKHPPLKTHEAQKSVSKAELPPKKEIPELVAKGPLSAKNQERLQEINQNLAFYCMKHRDHFSNEEQCLKFTKKILNECEKKHKLINTVMVNCIKTKLKIRR